MRILRWLFPKWPGWGEVFNPKQPWFLVEVVAVCNIGVAIAMITHG